MSWFKRETEAGKKAKHAVGDPDCRYWYGNLTVLSAQCRLCRKSGFHIQTAQGRTAVLPDVSEEALEAGLREASERALGRLIAYRDSLDVR